MLAGCTEALLTPFERVQTLMLDDKYRLASLRTKLNEKRDIVRLRGLGESVLFILTRRSREVVEFLVCAV